MTAQYALQYGDYDLEKNKIKICIQALTGGMWTNDKSIVEKTLAEKHQWRNNNPNHPHLFAKIIER